ncbi:hypothetical protein Tco_1492956 [Tanacetum coccineum]
MSCHNRKERLEALLNTLVTERQKPKTRNDDGLPEEEPNKFQVFRSACKLTGRMKATRLTTDVRQAVVWFVLNNSLEVDADILAYRESVPPPHQIMMTMTNALMKAMLKKMMLHISLMMDDDVVCHKMIEVKQYFKVEEVLSSDDSDDDNRS